MQRSPSNAFTIRGTYAHALGPDDGRLTVTMGYVWTAKYLLADFSPTQPDYQPIYSVHPKLGAPRNWGDRVWRQVLRKFLLSPRHVEDDYFIRPADIADEVWHSGAPTAIRLVFFDGSSAVWRDLVNVGDAHRATKP